MPNYLYQYSWATSTSSSFSLTLDHPVDQFTFTRTAITVPSQMAIPGNQTTFPAWSVTTRNSSGQELDSVHVARTTSSSDLPAETYTLSGPDITTIVFSSDQTNASYPYIPFDDFILEKSAGIKGDINGYDGVDLNDLIEAFKIISGNNTANIDPGADSNGDGKIGLADIIYILKKLAQ